jgi:nitrite transporter NirC
VPVPIDETLEELVAQAGTKAKQVRTHLARYIFLSALAGAFVGVAVVLLLSVSAPLVATSSPAAKLVQGAVFGVALTLVVFAGAELFTGNAMVMIQGLASRRIRVRDLLAVWVASLVGNLAGSIGFAALVHGGGTLKGPGANLVASIVQTKAALTGPQLFWRSVLCNMLVCLALWMAARTKSDGAKLAVLWWALLAFIASGFEHSVANMTLFGLGIFEHSATWSQLFANLAWTVPGNIVGGGLLIGLGYAWVGGARERAVAPAPAVDLAAEESMPLDAVPEPAMA